MGLFKPFLTKNTLNNKVFCPPKCLFCSVFRGGRKCCCALQVLFPPPWNKSWTPHCIQLAKILLLPPKNEIINVMLFCKIITFSHCKIWVSNYSVKKWRKTNLFKILNVHLLMIFTPIFFHGKYNYNIFFHFCLTNFSWKCQLKS